MLKIAVYAESLVLDIRTIGEFYAVKAKMFYKFVFF